MPIDVPQGINGFQPTISLTYDSYSSDGIGGWGWNIHGLSSISRIGTTLYHDTLLDPVDFDKFDRYALDGQRLMATQGEYGGDGSIYETESYSNRKIVSYGHKGLAIPWYSIIGSQHFLVAHPDGSQYEYGNTPNSSSLLEYALNKRTDPNKNEILYAYEKNMNLITITSIKWGGNAGDAPY